METPVVEALTEEKKKGPMIGAIAAIVLCGLTGLCLLCPASIAIFFGAQESLDMYFSNWYGIGPLCLSVIFIAIGVAVPIVLLRKKKPGEGEDASGTPQEPLPPAS